jgi:hypothetical protein
MEIEIDFEVFQKLTALRKGESDSYNHVIRRLLQLPSGGGLTMSDVDQVMFGAWFGNTHFPEGTKFRATYKGQTHLAQIRGGQWVGGDGVVRSSPSNAASAISRTNVNGWRFWYAQRPGDPAWRRLDELK